MLLGMKERRSKGAKGVGRKVMKEGKNFEVYPESYGSHNHWKNEILVITRLF